MNESKRELNVHDLKDRKLAQLRRSLREKTELVGRGMSNEEFVAVEDSHDYPELIEIWLSRDPMIAMEKTDAFLRILEHENLHAVPALGKAELGIDVKYGLRITRGEDNSVNMAAGIKLILPDTINVLTPEGEEIAVTLFEYAINPVLVNSNQKFSEQDKVQIAKYLQLFQPFESVYSNLLVLFRKLSVNEQLEILSKVE